MVQEAKKVEEQLAKERAEQKKHRAVKYAKNPNSVKDSGKNASFANDFRKSPTSNDRGQMKKNLLSMF